jgi:predicted nucleotidyltransferase
VDAAAILTEEEIRESLDALKARLSLLLGRALARLVLFGSRARGDADPDSDVDVAVVYRGGADAGTKRRILEAVTSVELERCVPLSTLIFSEEEFGRLRDRERRIALDIEREGIAL